MGDRIRVLHVHDGSGGRVADCLADADAFDVVEATVADGADRLAAPSDGRIDCVVDDSDGTALERVETGGADPPVVVATDDPAVAETALDRGAADCVCTAGAADGDGEGNGVERLLAARVRRAAGRRSDRAGARATDRERAGEVFRRVNRALVRADSPAQVESRVCELLADAEPYRAACVAGVDPETMAVEPRAWSGPGEAFADELEMCVAPDGSGRDTPAGRAYHDRSVAVSQSVRTDPRYERWRDLAVRHGVEALAVVPLEHEAELYGLLAVFADHPGAFDADERDLLADLGADVGHALHTERMRDDLREERALTESIFTALPDLFYAFDTDGTLSRWNDRFETVTGYDPATVAEMNTAEFVAPEDREQVATAVETVLSERRPVTVEARLQTADGDRIPYEFTGNAITDPDGDLLGLTGIGRDVSDRKARERELRRSERRFEAVFEDPRMLVGVLDTDGRLLRANETAMAYVDADPSAVVGEPFWETPWWSSTPTAEVREWIERAADGEYVEFEAEHRDGGGDVHAVAGTVRPVTDDHSDDGPGDPGAGDGSGGEEVVSLVVSARDVTPLRERERQLEVLDRMLRHDVRNAMDVIIGNAELIARESGGTVAERAGRIVDESRDLMATTEREREVVELLSGTATPRPVDLTAAVERAVERVRDRYPASTVAVTAPDRARARAVPETELAVVELVENAVRHAGPDPSVTVTVEVDAEAVTVEVADDGPGLPAAERRAVVDDGPIDQLHHATGMGLWFVRRVADRSGGSLAFGDDAEGGVVRIQFPRDRSDATDGDRRGRDGARSDRSGGP